MSDPRPELKGIVARCEAGEISPTIALMEMLIATEDERAVERALKATDPSPRIDEIGALLREHAAGCARVAAMLQSGMDSPPTAASQEEGVAFCRRLFDWSVKQSEEASVALYSLGSPALLDAATKEVASLLSGWGALDSGKEALDIGCGIGRMEVELASRLASIRAVDVSPEMLNAARRRCVASNVFFSSCSGLDLEELADGSFDLVFAVDSFPYIAQVGMPLVQKYFDEAWRVLRARGDFVILNFSYRGDLASDRRDVALAASSSGFDVLIDGSSPFSIWNGIAFRMRKMSR
jgi:SAM-dependent methyltransferase